MKKIPQQSIDGVLRPQHRLNLERADRYESKQKFISVRPHVTRHHDGTIDGIVQPTLRTKPTQEPRRPGWARTLQAEQPIVTPVKAPLKDRDVIVKLPRRWSLRIGLLTLLQYMVLAGVAVAGAYSTGIGQWFVLIYAVYALITRQDSRVSFGIALFVLISVPFFQVINQPGVANNMAVYVYELLVVGTVQALIELKWPNRKTVTGTS